MTDPSNQPWFHGRITRQEAEDLLQQAGKRDGTYLLRESTAQNGSYALSLCQNRKIIHYHIQRHTDGKVGIEDGPRFFGPVELVHHHMKKLDGLLAKLSIPCNRPEGVPPRTFSGINQEQVIKAANAALVSMHIEPVDETTAVQLKAKIESAIGSMMHANQSWFHGLISREEAERRLHACGFIQGMYLVRERQNPPGSFALGLCHDRSVVHYLFDSDPQGRLSIKSGPKFDNLMLAVDHYSQREDGLLCLLRDPCNVELFEERRRTLGRGSQSLDLPDFAKSAAQAAVRPASKSFTAGIVPDILSTVPGLPPKVNPTPIHQGGRSANRPLPPPLPNRKSMEVPSTSFSTSPRGGVAPLPPSSPRPFTNGIGAGVGEDLTLFESIYDSAKIRKSVGYHSHFKGVENRAFELNANNLTLEEELGHGQFGSVLKGQYKMPDGNRIPVAVKRLKSDEINNPKSEIMHEARIMMKLDHPYIVRIIGMCQASTMMIVMELAGDGPMNKYLKKHKDLEMTKILILMLQVAEGMAYLESKQFVHRDLAARNVLVVNEDFVKISDFGMSRAMGAGSDYYKAGKPGKWPLKWYAPECIYYRKFSSKSDVWSYGVTLWEATSYGAKPYHGLNGQVILEKIEENYRLPSPPGISPEVYRLMKSCWEYKDEDRPTFRDIGGLLYRTINRLKRDSRA